MLVFITLYFHGLVCGSQYIYMLQWLTERCSFEIDIILCQNHIHASKHEANLISMKSKIVVGTQISVTNVLE